MSSPNYENDCGIRDYTRASKTILNGPAVAFRMWVNPPARMTSVSFASALEPHSFCYFLTKGGRQADHPWRITMRAKLETEDGPKRYGI
jgi:hypothetical protein